MAFFAFSTPIFSTLSRLSRIPAVSRIFTFMPSSIKLSFKTSLVVPGISVTIALSSLRSAFIKEDFPTFVSPANAILIPSVIYLLFSEFLSACLSSSLAFLSAFRLGAFTSSSSSSG